MNSGIFQVPRPVNETVLSYRPGSPERRALADEIAKQKANPVDVPLRVGGDALRSGDGQAIRCPHDHELILGSYQEAGADEVLRAADAAAAAAPAWAAMAWEDRAAIFLKAADLLAGPWRARLNAATMLGQSKTVQQAEIDSACELVDFWRFNVAFMAEIMAEQPPRNAPGVWNRVEYRPLEGFVFALTPFNFTAIGGNLPTAPAMMGNVVLWKPASTAVLSAHYIMEILHEAGLPEGVINLIPGRGATVGDPVIDHPDFAGIHFTGSTGTFNALWKRIAGNLSDGRYRCYPRIVGETGGKDFVVAAPDADVEALAVALFRGAFEYQGQKCSAASRAYLPRSLWPALRERLRAFAAEAKMGDPADFTTFMGAVIDERSFRNIGGYLEHARESAGCEIVFGGEADGSRGWFVPATLVRVDDPHDRLMEEEIFGPVLTVYVYEDEDFDTTLDLVNETSPYALTGAVFARDRRILAEATLRLRQAAGNFYLNDKPTGAVVGQQPFGGARASGTNDKAGSKVNLLRWCNLRSIKESFVPPRDWRYPHMEAD